VLYRTTEVVTAQSQYGCDNPNLTPEECANAGTHEYSWTNTAYTDHGTFTENEKPPTLTIIFDNNSFSFGFGSFCPKIADNTYSCKGDEHFSNDVYTFTKSGFTDAVKVLEAFKCPIMTPQWGCSWDQLDEYTIIK